MMPKFYLLVLLCFIFQYSCSQNRPEKVSLIADWRLGEKVSFQRTSVKQELENGEITKYDSSDLEVTLKVIDSSASGYVLLYRMAIITEIDNSDEKIISTLDYELETSNTGEYLGLRNWESVRDFMYRNLDGWESQNADEKGKAVTEKLKSIFDTKEQIENVVFKEIGTLLDGYGYEYSLNEAVQNETLLPNPWGGPPLRGIETYRFDLTPSNFFQITSVTEFDSTIVKASITQVHTDLANKMGKSEEETESELTELNNIFIQDRQSKLFNLETGWLEHGTLERKIEGGNGGRVKLERRTYQRISDE